MVLVLAMFLAVSSIPISEIHAEQAEHIEQEEQTEEPIILTFNGIIPKNSVVMIVGEIQEIKISCTEGIIEKVEWSNDAPEIVSILEVKDATDAEGTTAMVDTEYTSDVEDAVMLEAKEIGTANITAKITTDQETIERKITVVTQKDTGNTVYTEDIQEETYIEAANLSLYSAGDITITFDGLVRSDYTTVEVGDDREVKISVEGETIKSIQWSSGDTSILTISGDKNGALVTAKSIGVVIIKAIITTNSGTATKEVTISTREHIDTIKGYANANADLLNAATESSYISRTVSKGDSFDIRGKNGKYYWISYDGSSLFILKSKVNIPAVEVILDKDYVAMKKNGQETLRATVLPDLYTGSTSWNSTKTDVATVNNVGKVTGVKEGIAKIQSIAESMSGNIQTDSTISVWTELNEAAAIITKNTDGKASATSDSSTVSSLAKDTSIKVIGQCEGYYYVRLEDSSLSFVEKGAVNILATSISLDSTSVTIGQGESCQLVAKILPELATDKKVLWSSNNSNVVKVDSNGKITGIKTGTAYVYAKTSDGKQVANCKVLVQKDQVSYAPPTANLSLLQAGYDSITVEFRLNSSKKESYEYYVLFTEVNNSSNQRITQKYKATTNKYFQMNFTGLDYNTTYDVKIYVKYQGEWHWNMGQMKTKKPTMVLSVKSHGEASVQLNIKTTPKKINYDSYVVRYKENGKKAYTVLGKKDYTRKGNLINIKKKLSKGKTYTFKVSYYNKRGKVICAKTAKVKRGDVVVSTKLDKKFTKITVSWNKVNFAKGYEIYRSETKGKLGKKIKTIKKAGTTKYIDTTKNLISGKKYYYKVRPYWNENKKKKRGSSNQSSILCRRFDATLNKQVLLEKMGLKDKIAGNKTNINQFGLAESGQTYYPAIKYQFDGKKLTMHLYIQYSSYQFNNAFVNGEAQFTEQSISTILKKKRDTGESYVGLFEKGLKKYCHNQTIMGSKKDFGEGVNFKTDLIIHRQDNSKESYHQNQQFIEIMIGGIDKYSYRNGDTSTSQDPYWYYALSGQKIYMPEDYQLKLNVERKTPHGDYMEVAAHEMGHILGLADAYYDYENDVDRCTENTETCIYEDERYHNMMKGGNRGFVANDFEMMLRAYKNGTQGIPATAIQAYKTFGNFIISEAIKNKDDKVETYPE